MATEDISPRYADLDQWPDEAALAALHEAQLAAAAAVAPALAAIAAAVSAAAERLQRGGRLVYVGAGTSGRIAVQDGAELGPTFHWPSERLAFVMAGGETALLRAVENAEDSGEDGAARIAALAVGPEDVVIGVAASGATPFTVSALETAHARGALTIGVANAPGSRLLRTCAHPILADTGAEPIAGSTRFKAGTAQKVALNLFSTQLMVRLGRVHRGLMVEMRPTNAKLRRRAQKMVALIAECAEEAAVRALAAADGDVKLAVLIARGWSQDDARAVLAKHQRNLSLALKETP